MTKRITTIARELLALDKAAGVTAAPWFAGRPESHPDSGHDNVTVGPFERDNHYEDTICEVWGDNHLAQENAALIVAMRNNIRALATAVLAKAKN